MNGTGTLGSKSEVLPARAKTVPTATRTSVSRPSVTKPVSPKLQLEKRLKQRSLPQPSQDMLAEKLEEEAKKKRMEMKKSQRLYEKLKQNGFQESKSVADIEVPPKKVTIPKTPQSKLDKKFGKKVPSLLRKSPSKEQQPKKKLQVKRVNGLTVPEPFHFEVDQRLSASSTSDLPAAAGLTAAELAQKFLQDPRHFAMPQPQHPPHTAPAGLTVAQAPVLQTELRSKSAQRTRPMSKIEQDDQLMQEFSAKPFKARPLNRRILYESAGDIGVPKVQSRPVTEAIGFELQYDKVRASHQAHPSGEGSDAAVAAAASAFKARPVPHTLREPAALPPKKETQLTLPQSPKLNGKERASSAPARRQKPHHTHVEAEKQQMQHSQASTNSHNRPVTQPQEFHFQTAARGAHYQAMLEEKIQREQTQLQSYLTSMQQQSRVTNTKRMQRALQTVEVPPKPSVKENTIPQPFQLSAFAKHEEAQEKLRQRKLQEDSIALQQASAFKAKPVPKSLFEETENSLPSQQQLHHHHQPVHPMAVVLGSDLRAEKRRQFDLQCAEKAAAAAEAKKQATQQQAEAEQRLVQELRRKTIAEGGLVFKAQPVGSHGHSLGHGHGHANVASTTAVRQPKPAGGSALAGGARRMPVALR